MSDIQDIKTEKKIEVRVEKYILDKKINKSRIEELENITNFDMVKFRKENQTLDLIIGELISGISRGNTRNFNSLTITEKEEVLKNIFIEKEEEI